MEKKETWKRKMGRLLEINDDFPKYLVTMNPEAAGINVKEIRITGLEDFLLMPDI